VLECDCMCVCVFVMCVCALFVLLQILKAVFMNERKKELMGE
jgi:hypothetical protein